MVSPLTASRSRIRWMLSNQVLSEKQAGIDPGVVDLIWINGENFNTLKQAVFALP